MRRALAGWAQRELASAWRSWGGGAAERAAAVGGLDNAMRAWRGRAVGAALRRWQDLQAGYFGVYLANPGQPKPYLARVTRGSKDVCLGCFATAEEAALCVARSPEGQVVAAARAAAPALPLMSEEGDKGVVPSGATLKEEGTVPPMPHGAFVKEEDTPANPVVKEEGVVPPMPPDAFVKAEAVVKEEERSDGRPKRKKTK